MELKDLTPKDIEKVFWEAMAVGWASEETGAKDILHMPGYKSFSFYSGTFHLLDTYCVHPLSNKYSGFITIWFEEIPVWTMNYSGYYPKEAIPFLKLALQKAVKNQQFFGGRGPSMFPILGYEEGKLRYINQSVGDFSVFSGEEFIESVSGEVQTSEGPAHFMDTIGKLQYQGMILI